MLHRAFVEPLGVWGEVSAPAVPELVGLLGGVSHGAAIGAIGAGASAAVPALEGLLRDPPEPPSRAADVPLAYWKITGDPGPALAAADAAFAGSRPFREWRGLGDLGHHAAAHADRLRALLDSRDDWTRVEAAHALYRVTGERDEAADILRGAVFPLAVGEYLPARWAALRHLRAMPDGPENWHRVLRELLDSDRRHGYWAGRPRIAEDRELRTPATGILES
ncbi:hypothetical protein [Thermomonospora umbrina]|uniref:HEAT repeat protein n=1 Tax=Thermomonospora umbrina TaxID=111806 RepID=A0A3D9SHQ1_9ACTN|nr:hypothetical protein [Thermomonospora umbrina]REE95422.1 hypothetical protein DFJ69_0810 [Thermomonospora umbrina]